MEFEPLTEEEEEFMDAHIAEIERVYGKERAEKANIGWGVGETGTCSKVYGNPCMCVTTYDKKVDGKYVHEHEEY